MFDEAVAVSQLLWVERDSETWFLRANFELGPERIALAVFDGLGARLFSMAHNGDEWQLDRAHGVAHELPVELMFADFALAFMAEPDLRPRITGGRLVTSDDGALRQLFRGRRLLLTVEFPSSDPWAGEVRYTRHDLGYRVRIVTVEVSPL